MLLWLASFALKATFMLLFAAFATRIFRMLGPSFRHLVWTATFTAILALPLLTAVVPHKAILAPRPTVDAQMIADSLPLTENEPSGPAYKIEPVAIVKPTVQPVKTDSTGWLVKIWVAGALLCLIHQLGSACLLLFLSRQLKRKDPSVYREIAMRAGVARTWRLVTGRGGPMTWGTLHPIVAMPESSSGWSKEQFETVLIHELTHVRRLDSLTQAIAMLGCALLWFNPLVWLSLRAQRAEAEAATDETVLESGVKPTAYADALLQVAVTARLGRRLAFSAGVPFMKTPTIETRIRTILTPKTSGSRLSRFGAILVLGASLLVAAPCAVLQLTDQDHSDQTTKQVIQQKIAAEDADRQKVAAMKLELLAKRQAELAQLKKYGKKDLAKANAQIAKIKRELARHHFNHAHGKVMLAEKLQVIAKQRAELDKIRQLNGMKSENLNQKKDELHTANVKLDALNKELANHPEISWKKLDEESKASMFSVNGGEPGARTHEEIKRVEAAEKLLSDQYKLYKTGQIDKNSLGKVQAELEAARANVQLLKSQSRPEVKAWADAEARLKRQEEMYKAGVIDQGAVNKAREELELAKASFKNTQVVRVEERREKGQLYRKLFLRDTAKSYQIAAIKLKYRLMELDRAKKMRDAGVISNAQIDEITAAANKAAVDQAQLRDQIEILKRDEAKKSGKGGQ